MFNDSAVVYQQVLTKQPKTSLFSKQTQTYTIEITEHGINTLKQAAKEVQTTMFPFPLQKATKTDIGYLDPLIQQLRHFIVQNSGQRAQISELIKQQKEAERSETQRINWISIQQMIPELQCENSLVHYVQGRLYVYGKTKTENGNWNQYAIYPFYTQKRSSRVEQLNECGWCGTHVESWTSEPGRPGMLLVCTQPSSIALMRLGAQGTRLGASGWLRADILAGKVVGSEFVRRTQAGSDYIVYSSAGRIIVVRLTDGKLQIQSSALLKAKNAPSSRPGQNSGPTVGEQLTTASFFDVSADSKARIWCGSASGRLFQAEFAADRPPQHNNDLGNSRISWGVQLPPPIQRVVALGGALLTGQPAFVRKSLQEHVVALDGLGAIRLMNNKGTVTQYSGTFVDFAISERFIVGLDLTFALKAFIIYTGVPVQVPTATVTLPIEANPGNIQKDAKIRIVGADADKLVVLCSVGQRSTQILAEIQLPFDLGLTQDIGRALFRAQH